MKDIPDYNAYYATDRITNFNTINLSLYLCIELFILVFCITKATAIYTKCYLLRVYTPIC